MTPEADRLLSEALDLCVRARKLDSVVAGAVDLAVRERMPVSGTVPLWVQEQYDRDLADWEARARRYLQGVMG